jgi:hypothetical protein
MLRARWPAGGHWTSFACAPTMDDGVVTLGRAGAAANLSTQIRYCTATTADKPFSEMQNFSGWLSLETFSQREKVRQT